jgi:hypothetical protein
MSWCFTLLLLHHLRLLRKEGRHCLPLERHVCFIDERGSLSIVRSFHQNWSSSHDVRWLRSWCPCRLSQSKGGEEAGVECIEVDQHDVTVLLRSPLEA